MIVLLVLRLQLGWHVMEVNSIKKAFDLFSVVLISSVGQMQSAGFLKLPIKVQSLEDRLKSLNIYEPRLLPFQKATSSFILQVVDGLPLPETFSKDQLHDILLKASTESLRENIELQECVKKFPTLVNNSGKVELYLRTFRKFIESYRSTLEGTKELDMKWFFKSNLPSDFFNDSILSYNTSDLFFRTLYDRTLKFFKRHVLPVKDNQVKFRNALTIFERDTRPLVNPCLKMLEYSTKLQLFVVSWNAKDNPEHIFELDYLDFEKLDKRIYSDLYKKFSFNLNYLRNKLLDENPQEFIVVFDDSEPITTVWKEIMQTITR